MMFLPFILVLLHCSVEIQGDLQRERNTSIECAQKKMIFIYLDFGGRLAGLEKFEMIRNTLKYLVEMLLNRLTCFKISIFSPRRRCVIDLAENMMMANFFDNEIPRLYQRYPPKYEEFSTFFDQLPNTGDMKHTLLYINLDNTHTDRNNRDDLLITMHLKSLQQVKGYDVVFLCMFSRYQIRDLNSMTAEWISPNKFLYFGQETYGAHLLNNVNKELLDVLKIPHFNRFQTYNGLHFQRNSSFMGCKLQLFFWMDFEFYEDDDVNEECFQEESPLFPRLVHFFSKLSPTITAYSVGAYRDKYQKFYYIQKLNNHKEFPILHIGEEYDSEFIMNIFNNQTFCNIHIEIEKKMNLPNKRDKSLRPLRVKSCKFQHEEGIFKNADLRIKVLVDENENDHSFVKKEDGTIVIWERDLDGVEFKAMLIEEIRKTKCANGCRFV